MKNEQIYVGIGAQFSASVSSERDKAHRGAAARRTDESIEYFDQDGIDVARICVDFVQSGKAAPFRAKPLLPAFVQGGLITFNGLVHAWPINPQGG
jgi:hypothetical protein